DMEVGGVERSLISMLHQFDYKKHQIDLMLYSHTGDFMNLLPHQATLLPEIKDYSTFRMSIGKVLQLGKFPIGLARMIAKCQASLGKSSENGYKQLQYMWKYALPFLPKMQKQYDVAISYLWPHYFVAAKVEAKTKLAWIHTDYSVVDTDIQMDIQMWREFDYLVAVSEACKCAFIKQYPTLKDKVTVMENIMAPDVVRNLANESIHYSIRHDDRFKVITVARLSYAKGIDQAVKALKILETRGYHDIVWYIVGYGGDEKMIRKLIMQYDL